MKRILLLLATLVLSLSAADVSGTWKTTAEGPNGQIERTFQFKADGSTLTGESQSSMMGKSTITNGKVDGDNISFSMTIDFRGEKMKVDYKGKVTGDEIKLPSTFGDSGMSIEWTGKRVSP